MVASRSGLEALSKMHPEVQIHLASIDELAAVRNATGVDQQSLVRLGAVFPYVDEVMQYYSMKEGISRCSELFDLGVS